MKIDTFALMFLVSYRRGIKRMLPNMTKSAADNQNTKENT